MNGRREVNNSRRNNDASRSFYKNNERFKIKNDGAWRAYENVLTGVYWKIILYSNEGPAISYNNDDLESPKRGPDSSDKNNSVS